MPLEGESEWTVLLRPQTRGVYEFDAPGGRRGGHLQLSGRSTTPCGTLSQAPRHTKSYPNAAIRKQAHTNSIALSSLSLTANPAQKTLNSTSPHINPYSE